MKKNLKMIIPACLVILLAIGGVFGFSRWYSHHRSGAVTLLSKVMVKDYGRGWKLLDEYEYDQSGNLLKQVRYNPSSELYDKEYWYEYEYDELGRKIEEEYYSYSITKFDYNSWRYSYEYDDDNNLIKNAELNGDGIVDKWWEYEYDASGNKIREVLYQNKEKEVSREWLREYTYDTCGNLREYVAYLSDGSIYSRDVNEYEYDDHGNRTKYLGHHQDGSIYTWHEYEYDGSGNLTRDISYGTNGSVMLWEQYTYGSFGILTKEKMYPDKRTGERTEYEYDSSGNLRKKTDYHPQSYDYEGGWDEYTYDAAGNLIKAAYWDGVWSRKESGGGTLRSEYKYEYITIVPK